MVLFEYSNRRERLCTAARNASVYYDHLSHRTNGFGRTWDQYVVAGQGGVGYFEVLRFCW